MKTRLSPFLPCSLLLGYAAVDTATAQSVQSSLAAAAPLVVSATAVGVTMSQSQPAGLLAASGLLTADVSDPAGHASAGLRWTADFGSSLAGPDGERRFQITHTCSIGSFGAAEAYSGPHEFLIQLQASAQTPVRILVSHLQAVTGGVNAPGLSVDLGDDGILDYTSAYSAQLGFVRMLDATPLAIRVLIGGGMSLPNGGLASALEQVTIRVVPEHHIGVVTTMLGCTGQPLPVSQLFAIDGVQIDMPVPTSPLGVAVLVLGLGAQPSLLGTISPTGLPCLLLPQPDALLLVSQGVPAVLQIPAAARPVSVYAQTVELESYGLITSDAMRITAQ